MVKSMEKVNCSTLMEPFLVKELGRTVIWLQIENSDELSANKGFINCLRNLRINIIKI
jgi:hypothetical protein